MNWSEGTKVTGNYCGTEFTGEITSVRFHTINSKLYKVDIKLNAPLTILGTERNDIMMLVTRDGREECGHFNAA